MNPNKYILKNVFGRVLIVDPLSYESEEIGMIHIPHFGLGSNFGHLI
jgi:hypothetical protein